MKLLRKAGIWLTLCLLASGIFFGGCAPRQEELSAKNAEVKVLTWNVFLGKGDGVAFQSVLESEMPDVMSFQEMKGGYDKFIVPFQKSHANYLLINDTIEGMALPCSTPILFNSDKLELLDFDAQPLEDVCQSASDTKSLSYGVFNVKETGKTFILVVFHGAYVNPKYEEVAGMTEEELAQLAADFHYGNVRQVVSVIDALQASYGSCPAIFGGDCNFNNEEKAYALALEKGYADAEKSALFERDQSGLRSNHSLGLPPQEGLTIDHLFGNDRAVFLKHRFLHNETAYRASDHVPVVVEVYLNND